MICFYICKLAHEVLTNEATLLRQEYFIAIENLIEMCKVSKELSQSKCVENSTSGNVNSKLGNYMIQFYFFFVYVKIIVKLCTFQSDFR